jgi:hypothetical protein
MVIDDAGMKWPVRVENHKLILKHKKDYSARLNDAGELIWNDGDIWRRVVCLIFASVK